MNRIRGEAALDAGGKRYRLLLTLGALAEIEDGLGLADLSAVGARLKTVRASDLAIVAAALLRGGGHDLAPAEVMRLPVDLGALAAAVSAAFAAAGLGPQEGEGEARPFAGAISSPSVSAA
jgi:hypothetical protein